MRGVSTGEGIIERVKDLNGDGKQDCGLDIPNDKRLFIIVEEFYRMVACSRREGNTLSTIRTTTLYRRASAQCQHPPRHSGRH